MSYTFSPEITKTGLNLTDRAFSRLLVHRVNLVDTKSLSVDPEVGKLVGSKSGIAILDSEKKVINLPPGSGAEVDFWVFGEGQVVVTHNNPVISKISRYPTLEQFCESWGIKRQAEKQLGVSHGMLLANLKTHGEEERFLNRLAELGIPKNEVVLLDQELPATDRLLKRAEGKEIESGMALRVSRVEALESVLMLLRQKDFLAAPRALFLDPNGVNNNHAWPLEKALVAQMYELAPKIEFILCCPSRWGLEEQIPQIAQRLAQSGVKLDYIMTDIRLISTWKTHLPQSALKAA